MNGALTMTAMTATTITTRRRMFVTGADSVHATDRMTATTGTGEPAKAAGPLQAQDPVP